MSKSGRQKCPFKWITVEGVSQKVTSNVVYLKDTPSGWGGSFRWHVTDKTPEQFEARIMKLLTGVPAGSSDGDHSKSRSLAALAQTSGFSTPGYASPLPASPAGQQSEPRSVTGSKKKLSPQSEQSQQPAEQKRRDTGGSAEPMVCTDSNSDRVLKKLLKKQREIRVLQEQSVQRTLTAEEKAKVTSLSEIELEIGYLSASISPTPPATGGSSGSARSAAPTMPAAARVAGELTASQAELNALVPPTRRGTRQTAIEVTRPFSNRTRWGRCSLHLTVCAIPAPHCASCCCRLQSRWSASALSLKRRGCCCRSARKRLSSGC